MGCSEGKKEKEYMTTGQYRTAKVLYVEAATVQLDVEKDTYEEIIH